MADNNNPLKKVRGAAKGVAYTGMATHWKCRFGYVIIITENAEALLTAGQKMLELKAGQVFNPELCPEVAVFQMTDAEVA